MTADWRKTIPSNLYRETGVWPARSRTGFGKARTGMFLHVVTAAGAYKRDAHVRFGATWLCGQGSEDVVFPQDAALAAAYCEGCMERESGPTVYHLYDRHGDALYVGSTTMRITRLRAHERKAAWWPLVDRMWFEDCASVEDAYAAEIRAIQDESPRFNQRGAVKRKASV